MPNHIYHQEYPYLIYKHTSKISGKSYIGYTSKTMEERLNGHISEMKGGSKYAFHNALRKYGADNFISTILHVCCSKDAAANAEIELIETYNSYKGGYNMNMGGAAPPITSGRNHYKSKEIIIDGIIFVSITDACEKLNTYPALIHKYLRSSEFNSFDDLVTYTNKRITTKPLEIDGVQYDKIHKRKQSVEIDGIKYVSKNEACILLNISIGLLNKYLNNKNDKISLKNFIILRGIQSKETISIAVRKSQSMPIIIDNIYYINGKKFSYENWIEHPTVKQYHRMMKLKDL